MFIKGGSAVDVAIATLFCEGVAMPQSMGLGGGFLMTVYTKSTGKVETLDAREVCNITKEIIILYNINNTLVTVQKQLH